MNQITDLNDLRIFAEVVEHGSVTAAAWAPGMQRSKLSRRVRAMEDELQNSPAQSHEPEPVANGNRSAVPRVLRRRGGSIDGSQRYRRPQAHRASGHGPRHLPNGITGRSGQTGERGHAGRRRGVAR